LSLVKGDEFDKWMKIVKLLRCWWHTVRSRRPPLSNSLLC